jgi:hypothetical protein
MTITTPVPVRRSLGVAIKKLPSQSLRPLGQDFDIMAVRVPDNFRYEDLLIPEAWEHVSRWVAGDSIQSTVDRVGTIIIAQSSRWLAHLRIQAVTRNAVDAPNGIKVLCVGPQRDADGRCCPVDVETGLAWTGLKHTSQAGSVSV